MPHTHWIVDGEQYSLEEARQIARESGSFYGFPLAALVAMEKHRDDDWWLSPSSATGCHRTRLLMAQYDYALPLERQWAPGVGTAIHAWLEHGAKGALSELKLETPLLVPVSTGEVITIPLRGTADYYDPESRRLTDYKTVSEFIRYDPESKKRVHRKFPEPNHIVQINLYRLLLESNGYPVDEATIWYVRVSKDATRKLVEVPLWDLQETYLRAVEYATPLAEAKATGLLPPPLPSDHPNAWLERFSPVRAISERLWAEDPRNPKNRKQQEDE